MSAQPDRPIPATIDGMRWLTGRWHGSHKTDVIEEQWSAPTGGAMMGMSGPSPMASRVLKRGARRWMTYRRHSPDRIAVYFENEGEAHDPAEEYRFERG